MPRIQSVQISVAERAAILLFLGIACLLVVSCWGTPLLSRLLIMVPMAFNPDHSLPNQSIPRLPRLIASPLFRSEQTYLLEEELQKLAGTDQGKEACEAVVGWYTIRQVNVCFEPIDLLMGKDHHICEIIPSLNTLISAMKRIEMSGCRFSRFDCGSSDS